MVPPMVDEFYAKYKHLSHQELYRMLHAGSPSQVDRVGDTWASVAETLGTLAGNLRQDLDQLLRGWSGRSNEEAADGLGSLARHARSLADEANAMRTGLVAMSQALAKAQRDAEAPPVIPVQRVQTLSPVLGSELGHTPTAEEQARAHDRIVWIVAGLAAQYGLTDHTNWPAGPPVRTADIIGGAVLGTHGHHRGRDGWRRRGTGLLAGGDLAGTAALSKPSLPIQPSLPVQPASTLGPHATVTAGAEAHGIPPASAASPATGRLVSGPVLGGGPAALPEGAHAAPPPVGMGTPGMALGAPVDTATGAAAEVSWQAADALDWIDPDDAAPPVLGG